MNPEGARRADRACKLQQAVACCFSFLTPQVADGITPFIPQGVSEQKQNPMIIHTHALLNLLLVPVLTSLLILISKRKRQILDFFSLLCLSDYKGKYAHCLQFVTFCHDR